MKKIKRNAIFLTASVLIFAGASLLLQSHIPEKRPNVILLMADDMGWGDTGYNGNEIIKTPNLDRMSREGLRFDRFYSGSAVCSPTRASVLIGRNPFRTGVFTANNGILRPEETTLPEALKPFGYTCGHFGKWHLGTLTYEIRDANRGKAGNKKEYNPPSLHGFDVNFSTESKVPTWDPMVKPGSNKKKKGDSSNDEQETEEYGTHYWNTDGEMVTENLEGDDSRVIMDRVLPFIENSVKEKKPFLAVVWFHAPHKPYVAGPEYKAMYAQYDENIQNYAGCITALDEQVGRLRKYLKDQGIAGNTMIWFCSDNGPENRTPGSTGGLRERKRSLHEGGVRVPGLLVWPDKIKAGRSTSIPCFTSDYLPTILGYAGGSVKNWPTQLDGTNLSSLIEKGKLKRKQAMGFMHGDQAMWMDGEMKLYLKENEASLYNIGNDRTESTDLLKEDLPLAKGMLKELQLWNEQCKESFEGKEYGTESVDRMGQKWHSPKVDPDI